MLRILFSGMMVLWLGVSPLESAPTTTLSAMESPQSTNEPPVSPDSHHISEDPFYPNSQSDGNPNHSFNNNNMDVGTYNLRESRGFVENIQNLGDKLESKLIKGRAGRSEVFTKLDKAMEKLEHMMSIIESKGSELITKMDQMMNKHEALSTSEDNKNSSLDEGLQKVNSNSGTLTLGPGKTITKRDSDDSDEEPLDIVLPPSLDDEDIPISSERFPSTEEMLLNSFGKDDLHAHTDSEEINQGDDAQTSSTGDIMEEETPGFQIITFHANQAVLDQIPLLIPQLVDPNENDQNQRLEIFEIHQIIQNEPEVENEPFGD